MKVYAIRDEVRKSQGKKEYTHYEYSFEMEKQAWKRYCKYIDAGYKVEMKKDWWTTTEIVFKKEGEK